MKNISPTIKTIQSFSHRAVFFIILSLLMAVVSCSPVRKNIEDRFDRIVPAGVTPSPSPVAKSQAQMEEKLKKARNLYKAHQHEEARKLCLEIIDEAGENRRAKEKARFMLGSLYFQSGEYEPAIREMKLILSALPENPKEAKVLLIQAYLASDRPDEGEKYFDISLGPLCRWKTPYSLLARIRYARFRISRNPAFIRKMRQALEEGVREAPSETARLMLSAGLALTRNRFDETASHLEKALKLSLSFEDSISVNFLLGVLKSAQKDKARRHFKKIIDMTEIERKIDRRIFVDAVFAHIFLADIKNENIDGAFLERLISKVPGGLGDPELIEFSRQIQGLSGAEKSGDWAGAIGFLEKTADSAMDESTEGDYFYDTLCRPYILQTLYRRMARSARKAGRTEDAEGYEKQGKKFSRRVFPPEEID